MNVENNSLISALVECDTSLNEGRVDFQTAMQRLGMESVFDIIQMAPSEFAQRLSAHSDADPDLAYKNATRYASLIGRLYREYKTSSPNVPQLARRTGIHSLTGDGPTWQSQFMEDWDSFVSVGAMAAIDSPVAYLAALWTFVQQLEATRHSDDPIDPLRILLDKRRPDLKTLLITRENTYTSRPMLEIVTQVLTTNLLDDLQAVPADKNKSIYQVLSERRFPFQLPYNFYHHQCQLGMAGNKPRLGELNYRVSRRLPIGQMPDNQYGKVRDTDLQAQQLLSGLSPEQQKLLCETCDIHLTRQDLIDGWVGIGSTHPLLIRTATSFRCHKRMWVPLYRRRIFPPPQAMEKKMSFP